MMYNTSNTETQTILNLMKNVIKVLFFFLTIFTSTKLTAGILKVGDCVFGQEGGDLVKVSWNGDTSGITMPDKSFVASKIAEKQHPLSWHKDLHPNLDLVWTISGDIDKINQMVDSNQPTNRPATWIWSGVKATENINLVINLDKKGVGRITIWQAGKKVGSCRCRSSSDTAKVPTGSRTITGKNYESHDGRPARKSNKASKKAGKDVWMYYAMCLGDETDGFFLHGGNQAGESGGCIRIPYYMDQYIYHLTRVGVRVEITQD